MGDFVLPRWAIAGAANWILDTGDQIPHASIFKFPSTGLTRERAEDIAADCFVIVFMVFDHGAFGGSLANWVFRVNARTSSQAFEILVGNVRNLNLIANQIMSIDVSSTS